MRDQLAFYAMGLIGALLCVPVFLLARHHSSAGDEDEDEAAASLQSITSNQHIYSIIATLGFITPMSLEVGCNFLEKLIKQTDENGTSSSSLLLRAMICFTLLVTSCLSLNYSVIHPNVRASWAALHVRLILATTIIMHQLYARCHWGGRVEKKWWYSLTAGWVLIAVAKAYFLQQKAPSTLRVAIIIGMMATYCFLLYLSLKHISQSWRQQQQQQGPVTLAVLKGWKYHHAISVATGLFSVWTLHWIMTNFRHQVFPTRMVGAVTWTGVSFVTAMCLVFFFAIHDHELRMRLAEAQSKLMTRSMFVRYASHEIRTPLNACVLGLRYLRSIIDDKCCDCASKDSDQDEEDKNLVDIVDEVEQCCAMAVDFMNNLLMFEKIDSMNLPMYFKAERLEDICEGALRIFALSAKQLNIRLKMDARTSHDSDDEDNSNSAMACIGSSMVNVDAPKLAVVLRNLISNALKFTPEFGEVTMRIRPVDLSTVREVTSFEGTQETTHYRVSITDTGPGLTEEEQRQLFGSFVQFSPNDTQKGGGSGIGLYLSQKIMEQHGTRIKVYSDGKRGTVFYMDIPRCYETKSEKDYKPSKSNSDFKSVSKGPTGRELRSTLRETMSDNDYEGSESSSKSTAMVEVVKASSPAGNFTRGIATELADLTILVVDDSGMNRKMLKRALKQHGVGGDIDEACDGVDLLSKVGVPYDHNKAKLLKINSAAVVPLRQYDILLVDENMPRMSGSEAVAKLRKCGYEGLVVGLTGNALKEELQAFCDAGANYALPKPFEIEQFIDIIELRLCTKV